MTAPTHQCDHLVIGGGLAGSMAALRLASADRNVTLLEKELGPRDKVCGEFLSSEAVAYLRSAGIDPLALGAVAIRTVRPRAGRSAAEVRGRAWLQRCSRGICSLARTKRQFAR
jgi:2-polyprenyl-6-methoxyphenol hydroxylase-like FAD-dependent oxidoreductase